MRFKRTTKPLSEKLRKLFHNALYGSLAPCIEAYKVYCLLPKGKLEWRNRNWYYKPLKSRVWFKMGFTKFKATEGNKTFVCNAPVTEKNIEFAAKYVNDAQSERANLIKILRDEMESDLVSPYKVARYLPKGTLEYNKNEGLWFYTPSSSQKTFALKFDMPVYSKSEHGFIKTKLECEAHVTEKSIALIKKYFDFSYGEKTLDKLLNTLHKVDSVKSKDDDTNMSSTSNNIKIDVKDLAIKLGYGAITKNKDGKIIWWSTDNLNLELICDIWRMYGVDALHIPLDKNKIRFEVDYTKPVCCTGNVNLRDTVNIVQQYFDPNYDALDDLLCLKSKPEKWVKDYAKKELDTDSKQLDSSLETATQYVSDRNFAKEMAELICKGILIYKQSHWFYKLNINAKHEWHLPVLDACVPIKVGNEYIDKYVCKGKETSGSWHKLIKSVDFTQRHKFIYYLQSNGIKVPPFCIKFVEKETRQFIHNLPNNLKPMVDRFVKNIYKNKQSVTVKDGISKKVNKS